MECVTCRSRQVAPRMVRLAPQSRMYDMSRMYDSLAAASPLQDAVVVAPSQQLCCAGCSAQR
jgi:hypothetical protein